LKILILSVIIAIALTMGGFITAISGVSQPGEALKSQMYDYAIRRLALEYFCDKD
jgi:hypothetical protein